MGSSTRHSSPRRIFTQRLSAHLAVPLLLLARNALSKAVSSARGERRAAPNTKPQYRTMDGATWRCHWRIFGTRQWDRAVVAQA